MENYKILENRPELSPTELTQGMDFTKLKASAAASKMTALKIIIIKAALGVAIIASGIIVYNNTKATRPNQVSNELTALTDTSKSQVIVETKPIDDTIKEIPRETIKSIKATEINTPVQVLKVRALTDTVKPVAPIAPISTAFSTVKNCQGSAIVVLDTLSREKDTETTSTKRGNLSINTNINSCKIWHAGNFCNTSNAPDYKYTMECDGCDFDYVNCENVKSNESVCILITLTCKGKQDLRIESKLKNIILTDTKGNKAQTPMFVGIGSDGKFLGPNFKAKKLLVNYTKQINLYIFFKSAKSGDKLVIKDMVEAIVED